MTAESAAARYHALDALRAAMMFLGIYLHAVVAYSPSGGWPYKQVELTTALDFSISIIHVFRMPAFYVMAGFFAALLLQRYGAEKAARNRFLRIVVPFVVGWVLIFPPVALLAGMGRYGFDVALDGILSGRFLAYAHPLHLWFLEYLIVLYALAALVVVALPVVVPATARGLLLRLFRSAIRSRWAPLILAVPSFLAMLAMPRPWLEDPPSFVPVARIVIAYAIPFAVGWLLFLNTDLLEVLGRRAWLYTALAVVASLAYLASFAAPLDPALRFYLIRAIHAVAMWLLIFAVAGLFLRYLGGHSPLGRYLCDSSYFLYIASMPVLMAFQLVLKDALPTPLAKIFLALSASVAVLLVVYHYAVRPTFIGAVLNGRRYPRRPFPWMARPAARSQS
jgi:peptidoglycan/LPS O-acetylase OafA/YrhL